MYINNVKTSVSVLKYISLSDEESYLTYTSEMRVNI